MARDDNIIVFPSREAMADRVSDVLTAVLGKTRAESGSASIAVSGGSTPDLLYRSLALRPLDWARMRVTLVDERWTPPGTAGSNETFLRGSLLHGRAAEAEFEGFWRSALDPEAAAARADRRVSTMTPLSAVVLGLGVDGHTASWFPYADGLAEALADRRSVVNISANQSAIVGEFVQRLTLTLGAVRSADFVCLYITGNEKRDAYVRALAEGPVEEMPVRAIMKARSDMWVCWAE